MPRSAHKDRSLYWKAVVEGLGASGLSVREYCRKQRVSMGSFYSWRQRLAGQGAQPGFAEVEVQPQPSLAQIELVVAERYRLRLTQGFDEELLCRLVRLLERLG